MICVVITYSGTNSRGICTKPQTLCTFNKGMKILQNVIVWRNAVAFLMRRGRALLLERFASAHQLCTVLSVRWKRLPKLTSLAMPRDFIVASMMMDIVKGNWSDIFNHAVACTVICICSLHAVYDGKLFLNYSMTDDLKNRLRSRFTWINDPKYWRREATNTTARYRQNAKRSRGLRRDGRVEFRIS